MKIIVGLGNPGEKYYYTRHNIGFRVLDAFIEKLSAAGSSCSKYKAETVELLYKGEKILLVKPMTYMNLSGESVQQFVHFYKINPEKDLLIVFDDKDIPFGDTRYREEGSSGGHNGLKSLISLLGTQKFPRLKCGIGHAEQKIPTDAFVLQRFSSDEEEELPSFISTAVNQIEEWIMHSEE